MKNIKETKNKDEQYIKSAKTDVYSIKYKAIYEPYHYTFHYSTESNVIIDGEIDDQIFTYDEKQKIRKGLHKTGYMLKGWSLSTASETITLKPDEEVINFSDIDNDYIVLYPKYEVLRFKITYIAGKGKFDNGQKSVTIEYSYNDKSNILYHVSGLASEEYILCWKVNDKMIYSMEELKKYIDNMDSFYIVYAIQVNLHLQYGLLLHLQLVLNHIVFFHM